jgi:hypothetical protein
MWSDSESMNGLKFMVPFISSLVIRLESFLPPQHSEKHSILPSIASTNIETPIST